MIWYWPLPSVATERAFSISAALAASTVTPGSTAPDVSLTVPAIVACAYADAGSHTRLTSTHRQIRRLFRTDIRSHPPLNPCDGPNIALSRIQDVGRIDIDAC